MIDMIEIDTNEPQEAIDITKKVDTALQEEEIENGIAFLFTLHTTTALTVNEADPALMKDIMNLMDKLAPEKGDYFHDHDEGNAHAHLRATLIGNSVTIPVSEGRMRLGTWQRILFFEFDGPRRRRICIKTISDRMD